MRDILRTAVVASGLVIASMAANVHALSFPDPLGDTFGSPVVVHDITSIGSSLSGDEITFFVDFAAPVAAPSDLLSIDNVVGFIDIDTDQEVTTGAISHQTSLSPSGPSRLGVEYFLDVFSEEFDPGRVDVIETGSMTTVGTAPIIFEETFFSITVPLTLLGDDDGRLNYGVVMGDFVDVSDEATNTGLPPAFTVPEPTGLCLVYLAAATTMLHFYVRRL